MLIIVASIIIAIIVVVVITRTIPIVVITTATIVIIGVIIAIVVVISPHSTSATFIMVNYLKLDDVIPIYEEGIPQISYSSFFLLSYPNYSPLD